MNFFAEYALLFAVSLPMVVIVGIQVVLFLEGERGTLLIPGFTKYPTMEPARSDKDVVAAQPGPAVVVHVVLSAPWQLDGHPLPSAAL